MKNKFIVVDESGLDAERLTAILRENGYTAAVKVEKDDGATGGKGSMQICVDLVDNAPIGIFRSTPEGKFIMLNPACARLLKFDSPEQMLREVNRTNIADALYADPARRQEIVQHLMTHDCWCTYEERFRCRDGTIITCFFHLCAVPTGKGLIEFQGFIADISERKQTEESRRLSQSIIDKASIGIFRGNEDGRILYVNDHGARSLGYTREELCAMTFFDILPDLTPEWWREHREKLVSTGSNSFESVHRRKDGSTFPVKVSVSDIAFGDQILSCSFAQDITELKAAEERLKLTVFSIDNIADAIQWIGVDTRFWNVNRAACEMLGYTREEYLSLSIADIDPYFTMEEWRPHLEEIRQSGRIYLINRYHRRKDGRIIPVEITSNYFQYEGVEYYCAIVRDITQRDKAEKEASFFRALIEYTRDPVYVIDPADGGRMVYANQAACCHFGKSFEQLQTMSIPDWDPEFDLGMIEVFQKQMKQGEAIRFETVHRVASGELVPVEVTANHLEHDGRELVAGYFSNISKRKDAEEQLRNSERRLRTLLQTLPDLVWLKDQDGVYLSCNSMFERFFGASEAEIIGKTDYDFVDRELADFFTANDRRAMAAGKPTVNEEWITFADDGHRALLETIKTPVPADDGELIGVLGIGRDITQRKRAEEELQESEARYRGLVDLFPDAIYIHTGGRLVFVNSQGAKLLGAQRPEELYGREALDFVHPDYRDFVSSRIANAFTTGETNPPVEEVFVGLDGTPVPVEVSSTSFDYKGEKALQILARDISNRKKRQEEQHRAQKLESLGVLAGGIAHDFNNLLTGIMGNLSLIRVNLPADDKARERIDRCEKAVKEATGLTCQLLTFARGGEPVKKVIDLGSVVENATAFVLRGSNVAAKLTIAEDLWPIEADEGQVAQVINNLLINADQSMAKGGVVRVDLENCQLGDEVPTLTPGPYVRITVADQGCGITPENLDRIFDPYFTTKQTGTGLGLTSLYSIVKKHGGDVAVFSKVGEGTVFKVLLPALPGGEKETQSFLSTLIGHGDGGSVIVMDDEENIREVAGEILTYLGYLVSLCDCGEEAVSLYRDEMAQGRRPVCVIMDLTIPGRMGGVTAASKILEMDPTATLIVASGYSNDPIMANYASYGFTQALHKPFSLDEIIDVLNKILSNSP